MNIPQCPEQIVGKFHIQGGLLRCREFGSGHINDTYKIETDDGHVYILQRINPRVFTRPVEVMENVSSVTDFLRKTLKCPRETLHFLRTDDNLRYFLDENGLGDVYLSEMLPSKTGWNKPFVLDEVMRGYTDEMKDFMECIQYNREPKSGFEMAYETAKIIYAAYMSAELGQVVEL